MSEDPAIEVVKELAQKNQDPSEFGRGCTYCLGLFLKHAFQHKDLEKTTGLSEKMRAELWFNGASDHLYEMQIPEAFPEWLQQKIKVFSKEIIGYGHGFTSEPKTMEMVDASIAKALEILKDIDAFMLNVEVEDAQND